MDPSRGGLSAGALAALSRAITMLDLTAVPLMCNPADGQRAVAAGLPIAELVPLSPAFL